jgi:hypothetical protein
MGVSAPPCRRGRALCRRRLYSRHRPRSALSRSQRGNWPRAAQMQRVGSVLSGGCGVELLRRLSGYDPRPLRTSPNLSLRYSHGPDKRWTSWRASCWQRSFRSSAEVPVAGLRRRPVSHRFEGPCRPPASQARARLAERGRTMHRCIGVQRGDGLARHATRYLPSSNPATAGHELPVVRQRRCDPVLSDQSVRKLWEMPLYRPVACCP